jgi:hypothetical protein
MYPEVFFWRHRMIPSIPTYAGVPGFPPPTQRRNKFFLPGQADRGFARSQLCTNEDGTTNNLVLYMVRNDTSKKGGGAPRATD